jgi:hypothetical protein
LKVYYRDDRHRLDREYSSLRFLNSRGMAEVPTALLRDDDLGPRSTRSRTVPGRQG